jgi:RNA polymerase sigma-70 factor (ECF subfamily)
MPENDAVLLERFSRRSDAEAFAELVRRYARLVYATAWRVLRQETDAADVTQETFFELTRQAGRIGGPLSGWLHRVATQKSIDVIRRRSRRKSREQTYAQARPAGVPMWQDLSGFVDEALEKLNPAVKSLLLDHFLAGRTMAQIVEEHGVSQATVSRRVNEGLEQLRGMLRRQGLLVGGAALGTLLLENTSQAVPVTVYAGLSKMAMVGTTATAASLGGQATVAVNAGAVKAVLAATTIAVVVSVVGYVHYSHGPPPAPSVPAARVVGRAVSGTAMSQSAPARRTPATRTAPPENGTAPAAVLPAAEPTQAFALSPEEPAPAFPGMGGIAVGDPFSDVPTADLRTPEAVVYSFLALIDQGAADQLQACLADGAEVAADDPFPRYLGYPIRLVEVMQKGDAAQVRWEATVHTPFSCRGRDYLPGESVALSSRLVRMDGLWKLLKLDE